MVYKFVKEGNDLVKTGYFMPTVGAFTFFIRYKTLSTFFIEFNVLSS